MSTKENTRPKPQERKQPSPPKAKRKAPQSPPAVVDVRLTNPGDISAVARGYASTAEPFWMKLPRMLYFWGRFLLFPVTALKFVMELALCGILLSVFGVVGMWATGMLTKDEVMPYISDVGERTLELLRALGFPI